MLRELVHPGRPIVHGQQETYELLQQNGQVVLQQPYPSTNLLEFIPTMPLISFRGLVKTARSSQGLDNIDRFIKLDNLLDECEGPYTGGELASFKIFAVKHTALMNEFFADYQKKEKAPLSLSRRYAKGYGGAGDIEIRFVSEHCQAFLCPDTFPKVHEIVDEEGHLHNFADGNCYLNAPNASFADAFYSCSKDVENVNGRRMMTRHTVSPISEGGATKEM